jgi:uncharacterized membrane protein
MERDKGTYAWIGGLALGAAVMYFLDPHSGRRRRARVRDRVVHTMNVAEEGMERLAQDFGNRARGTVARTRRRVFPLPPVEDDRLEARVRSALGRLTSHPSAIQVEAHDGVVTLRGPILEHEIGEVLVGVRRVPGVRRVESRLETVQDAAHVPALQGGRPRMGMVPDMFQRHMSPTSRALLGTAGGLLAAWGMRRGNATGVLSSALGGLMLARAATNMDARDLLHGQTLTVQKCVDVLSPIEEVFAFWSNFRNFPRFMQHVREVRELDEGVSHWVADGPAGVPVSWDAEITSLRPYRRIAWRSLPGSTVENAGEVRFIRLDDDHTRIHVRMAYHPPVGVLGQAVAAFFGADPKHQLADDLNRFKSLLEEGQTTAHHQVVARQDVQPEMAVEGSSQ